MCKHFLDRLYFDPQVSKAVLQKIENHLWYLSEEAAGFSFFDDQISVEVKRKMVLALNNGDDTDDNDNNEIIPKIKVATIEDLRRWINRDMSSFVTPKTNRFFNRLSIDTSFLITDPSTWQERPDFCACRQICAHLNVVNDAAERALKLITDYNRALTHNEEDKQFVLQAIEHYRNKYPHNKSDLIAQRD